MDKYMSLLAFTLRHRWTTVVGGFLSLVATVFMFAALPQTFFPDTDQDFTSVTVEMVPGTTLEQTGAAARQVEAVLRRQPEVDSVFSRVRVGNATVSVDSEGTRRARAHQPGFRAGGGAACSIASPDARAFFRSQQTGGRALNLIARRRGSGRAQPGGASDRRGNGDDSRAGRAAHQRRPAAARDRDPPAARPRRRSRRHHRGAEQRDPHRDPGRDRPEQRPLLAERPPDPDPRGAQRECAPEARQYREPAGADRRPAARCR